MTPLPRLFWKDGKYGPIPEATRKSHFEIDPEAFNLSGKVVALRKVRMTYTERCASQAAERVARAHLMTSECCDCVTLFDALVHESLLLNTKSV